MKKASLIIFLFLFSVSFLSGRVGGQDEKLTLPVVPKEEISSPIKEVSPLEQLDLPVFPQVEPLDVSSAMSLPPSLQLPDVPLRQPVISAMPSINPLQLPQAESQIFEIGTHKFGGVNQFVSVNQIPIGQAILLRNFLPEGLLSLGMRRGYEKINFTNFDGCYGATIAQDTLPQILISCRDSLRYADSSTSWEFTAIDTTEAILTYFGSTPFGVVVTNGTDSARIWEGSSIRALGVADTGTFTADTTDANKTWTADYWVGYYAKCGTCQVLFEIVDNGSDWLSLGGHGVDTCQIDSAYQILSRPDSSASGLTFPKGKASAYFDDRFFINSDYYNGRIYYSVIRDPDDIPIENLVDLDIDQHDEVVRMVIFNGKLFVFGNYSIHGINVSQVATTITKSVGCIAPYTIALGDDYVYFLGEDGVYRTKANLYASFSFNFEKISDQIDDIIQNIDPQNIDYCGGVYLDKQYWFSYHPDSCVVFDERTNQWYPQDFGFMVGLSYSAVLGKTWNQILLPDADGDTIEWTPSTGSNYACVDDPDDIDQTDWVSTTLSGKKDFYTFTDATQVPTGSTSKLKLYVTARYNASGGYINLDVYVMADGDYHLLETFTDFYRFTSTKYSVEEINPVTDNPWNKGDLDSLVLAIISSGNTQVYSIWVYVEGQGDLTASSFLFGSPPKEYIFKYGGVFQDDTTTSGTSVYGKPIIAQRQSGWIDNNLPIDDKLLRLFYLQTEKDTGNVWVRYYTDYSTTPSDSDLVHLGGKKTTWWMLGEKVKGKNFSVDVYNESNIDSLTIKGWWGLLNNLGKRGGE